MAGEQTKYCSNCGANIDYRAEICPQCGVRVAPPPTGGKNKLVAALLAIFLGGLGIHKFYLGRIGWGIVYILFCWTFIPSIVAFIEGIIYLTMSETKFTAKYAPESLPGSSRPM